MVAGIAGWAFELELELELAAGAEPAAPPSQGSLPVRNGSCPAAFCHGSLSFSLAAAMACASATSASFTTTTEAPVPVDVCGETLVDVAVDGRASSFKATCGSAAAASKSAPGSKAFPARQHPAGHRCGEKAPGRPLRRAHRWRPRKRWHTCPTSRPTTRRAQRPSDQPRAADLQAAPPRAPDDELSQSPRRRRIGR